MPSPNKQSTIRGMLFDLDGTLADTAPDMASALNSLRQENHLGSLDYANVRNHVSHGSAAMIRVGFGDDLPPAQFEALRTRFLEIYAASLAKETHLFHGMPEILSALEERGILWGIVTNKPGFLSTPLIEALGLSTRTACLISGDHLPLRKPDPAPLRYAAQSIALASHHCCYLGDAERDIQAGRAAGMQTLVAGWGYIDSQEQPQHWGADGILNSPQELLQWLDVSGRPPFQKL